MADRLKKLRHAEIALAGFKFGFKVEAVGTDGGPTLAEAFAQVVDQAKSDIVLIVDEVQHAITSEEGHQMLLALKAARDAINPRPETPGHFIFVGTGSHRALVSELTARRNQAFAGATSIAYPVLDRDYVEYLLARLHAEGSLFQMRYEPGAPWGWRREASRSVVDSCQCSGGCLWFIFHAEGGAGAAQP